ncbi:MAG: threonine--tRNA ligase [Phycisphaerae bacterium]|nr:threonine--tRNA ligase [Phycisphaerae bacterium]
MITVTLPDGKTKSFDKPVSGLEVAQSIGAGLAKAALAVKVDFGDGSGLQTRDLSTTIDRDATVALITMPKPGQPASPEALQLIRHSAAHVMAEAIQDVIGKDVQLAYGPPTDTGFFSDMLIPEGKKLSSDHFEAINKRMAEIVGEDRRFCRYEVKADEGLAKLEAEGNKYKTDNAERALGRPSSVYRGAKSAFADAGPEASRRSGPDATLSFYATGEPGKNWEDLCRGPHVPSTGRIGAIKVMSLASAFWHGDENSDRLTRVYGTAFPTQAELDAHLKQLDEAKARDHREIGKRLRLFHIDETVGQGLVLWTPAGAIIRKELQAFIAAELRKQGYTEVFTPHVSKLDLFKMSGHFPYYKDSQYPPFPEREALEQVLREGCSCAEMMHRLEGVSARLAAQVNQRTGLPSIGPERVVPDENLLDGYMLKPMNCPMHIKIFDTAPRSYRDMPVRLAEFGTVYRWEQSGELNGMTRVRGFTQDDAHIFCTQEQVPQELAKCLSLVRLIFDTLEMRNFRVRVGLRSTDSSKFTGRAEDWDRAEAVLREAAGRFGAPFSEEPGEAAFYGPKIDFVVKDVIGREWQLGTVQVDYNLPIRFGLSYIGPDNKPHTPVMIHRAPFGSMERFCGVLIEHFAGAFPTWLSPEQVRVLPISEKTSDYAAKVEAALREAGVRVTTDSGNDRIQAKIKVAAEMKIPYLLIVGPRDAEQNAVSLRIRGEEKDAGAMPLERFVEGIKAEIAERRATLGVRA